MEDSKSPDHLDEFPNKITNKETIDKNEKEPKLISNTNFE